MSKKLIKIVIGSKKIVKKIDLDTKLSDLREILKDNIPENGNFMLDDAIIEKSDEKEYTIKDIQKNYQIVCSINTTNINIYLNGENILKIDINANEKIESLIKELNGKIPNNSKIKYEDVELTFDEVKKEEMTIKDLALENSIYFINQNNNQKDENTKEENFQNNMKKENLTLDNSGKKDISEKFIHIYRNGEVIKMGLFNINISLSSLRELIKTDISKNARFLSEGIEVPLKDESNIKLYHILKENIIYIEDSIKEEKKIEKIPIILKIHDSTSIIKALVNDKLDTIREQNFDLIKNNYLFTLHGSIISREQESTFTISEIMDKNNTVLLKDNKPKIKIKILEENKSVKSEQNYDPSFKLSDLRRELSIESSKVFKRGTSEIEIGDEDNLTVADVQIEGKINIMEKSIKYAIFVNNKQILSECYPPSITVATLRTYLLMHIPKDCSFIHAIKQTPIPQEIEDTILINKICDDNNSIFIESEQKKVISLNKPLEKATFLRKEGELDIYLFPSRKFIIGNPNSSHKEKTECMKISKEINRKILMVVGQTGSGKTTLLNSLINALCCIQLQDNFRYIIIDEFAKDSGVNDPKTQAKSRTSYVTAYNIDSFNDNPPITIIDTPGFGDSRGMKFDEKIVEMIRELFKEWIDSVNGICFVASSSSARLTSTQKYIFSSIVSLFGNDIAENFVPMLTFCDGKEP